MDIPVLVVVVIAVALIFDYINGFHDAANSVATIVATRVLSPFQAVLWAAFWNFVSAFSFGTAVAATVGQGLVDLSKVDSYVILAGLLGAIVWDLITWYWGLPRVLPMPSSVDTPGRPSPRLVSQPSCGDPNGATPCSLSSLPRSSG